MLKKPSMLQIPNVSTSLYGGDLACSGNTCASGYSCSSVDTQDTIDPGCQTGFAIGGIISGVAAGVAVGIVIT